MNVSIIVVLLTFSLNCYGSKYSAEKNKNVLDYAEDENPFRMRKVNLLWGKANKRLTSLKLADLYADLLVHDKHEAALKKFRAENMDKDGLKEAHVNAAFREIIEKFGLEELYDGKGNPSNEIPLAEDKKAFFSDKKLQSMWKRTESAGFSVRDLQKLKEEFWHQQMKIDEMNFLRGEMNVEDNEIESSKKTGKTVEQLKLLNTDMKKKHKDIKAGYYDLEGRFDEFERETPEFKDSRVYQLWAVAQKTGWKRLELEAFKDELRHFETRLEKHEILANQVQRSADMLEEEGLDTNHEKHLKLEAKANDIEFKVQKLHKDLKTRVSKAFSRHSEL